MVREQVSLRTMNEDVTSVNSTARGPEHLPEGLEAVPEIRYSEVVGRDGHWVLCFFFFGGFPWHRENMARNLLWNQFGYAVNERKLDGAAFKIRTWYIN